MDAITHQPAERADPRLRTGQPERTALITELDRLERHETELPARIGGEPGTGSGAESR